MECQTVGCGAFGGPSGSPSAKCKDCERIIHRCGFCWNKFRKVQFCSRCTEKDRRMPARVPLPQHDDERDVDANGWLANARRFLEELE